LILFFDVSTIQDDINKLSRNVGNQLLSDKASYLSYRLQVTSSGGTNGAAAPGSRTKGAANGGGKLSTLNDTKFHFL
jgi:hypothetical protein